jgi:DNA-binding MarR family transcriptional regulator
MAYDGDARRSALDRVIELSVLLTDDMTRTLARDGLTTSRAHILWVLVHRGPTTQRALADALGVSPRTVTGLVDGLVASGFVTREPHPTDRRAILVTFTPLGERTARTMDADHRHFADLLFADMPARRFAAFVGGLDDVLAVLRAHAAPPDGAAGEPT